jgi:phospholipid/cholesterol/gamma-HCH transport system substrate-binding protein
VKAFTERNHLVIGLITIALIVGATGSVLVLNAGIFAGRYDITAEFADSAGLRPGDRVRVAGVLVGEVAGVEQAGDQVEVQLDIDDGTELSQDTSAEIVVETVLGTKFVQLSTGQDWSSQLESGDVITDTQTPVELLDVQDTGAALFTESDGESLGSLIDSLTEITEDKRSDVETIVEGVNAVTEQIDLRDDEARRLLDSADTLTATLSERDQELVTSIESLNTVLDVMQERRTELVTLLEQTVQTSTQTADLVGTNRERLDSILSDLHVTLQVIGEHQVDLAAGVAYLGVAIEGFASIGYSGEARTPHPWGNIYTQLIGPTAPDGLFGSCGPVDFALDLALGPDPLPCREREGQLINTGGATAAPTTPEPPGGTGGGAASADELIPAPDGEALPTDTSSSLGAYLVPILGGGS